MKVLGVIFHSNFAGLMLSERLGIQTKEFSVYVRGRFNPAILSHDFLVKIEAIPVDAEAPEPLITPVIASLSYEKMAIGIRADVDGLLVSQQTEDPTNSHIISLTSAYLGALEHTPIEGVSLNFSGDVVFETAEQVSEFETSIVKDKEGLMSALDSPNISAAVRLLYDFEDFRAVMRLGPIDPVSPSFAFSIGYRRKTSGNEHISLLKNESLLLRLIAAHEEQLRGVCKRGLSHA